MNIFLAISKLIFRRGIGIFKLLFAIDDLIRLFTMTIVFVLGLTLLDAPRWLMMAGTCLGLLIDVHDIFDDIKEGKPLDLGFN